MNPELPQLIAHRGESGLAPENTLSAIKLAATGGTRWVELDANISADGIVFIHHDDTLDRCTNGTGLLVQKTSAELDDLDAGAWFGSDFKGEPLPRLSAVIELLASLQMGLNLEIKPSPGKEVVTANAVCQQLQREWPVELPLLLSSFSEQSVEQAHYQLPGQARGLIVDDVPADWLQKLERLDCKTIHCNGKSLTEVQAQNIRAAGFGLLCWTVNSEDVARRLFSWGVDSIFTDYPTRLRHGLEDVIGSD